MVIVRWGLPIMRKKKQDFALLEKRRKKNMLAAKTHQLKKGSIKPTKVLIPILYLFLYLPFTFQSCMYLSTYLVRKRILRML